MNVLAFAASHSKESLNRRLIGAISARLRARGVAVDMPDFREFDMPLFDPGFAEQDGLPPAVQAFARRVSAADGIVVASPEYLHGPSAALKNAIEWVSRLKPVPLSGKPVLLVSATASPAGGVRGLMQLRETLSSVGMWVAPHVLGIGRAAQAFDADGELKDARQSTELNHLLDGFVRVAAALARS